MEEGRNILNIYIQYKLTVKHSSFRLYISRGIEYIVKRPVVEVPKRGPIGATAPPPHH